MTVFNTMAVAPPAITNTPIHVVWPTVRTPFAVAPTQIHVVWPTVRKPFVVAPTQIHVVWPTAQQQLPPIAFTLTINAIPAEAPRFQYTDGYTDGELYGFSSQHEETMEPIQLGETDDDKKTVSFRIYTETGLPASGLSGGGPVCVPGVGAVQTNRDLAGYVNSTGTFSHVGDGVYRYTFANVEVVAGSEGNTWLRVLVAGFRTVVLRVPIRTLVTANAVRDAVLNAVRSGFVTSGTVGEGIALAASLLQGNYYMDTVTNTTNGQTAARLRCFHTGAATTAATAGGTGQGEFATFLVTTTYTGPNKISEHRVVQQ
jgi:hypothetical protein